MLWTDASLGFGNLLYRYLHAWTGRRRGIEEWVLEAPSVLPWLGVFPELERLTIARDRVSWRDRRDLEDYQGFGSSFTREELDHFVRHCLLVDTFAPAADVDGITLNVRRGDYYSPTWRHLYGFDVESYVSRALEVARGRAPFDVVRVVSDDLDWCTAHLARPVAGVRLSVTAETGPVGDLRTLAGSRRVVLANSTFSYWGAFLSNVVHGDNHADVVAPAFHRRDINGGRSWHLDPSWSVVEDPAGWPATW